MRPDNEIRPNPKAEADSKSFGGDDSILADLDGLDAIHHAWITGFDEGFARGQIAASEEKAAAILHRRATAALHLVADLPERDHEADLEAAARREARWSA